MSLCRINFYSSCLNRRIDVTVILPEHPAQRNSSLPYEKRFDKSVCFPAVYLLNGLTGDYTDWVTMMPTERLVCENGIAAVIPSGENSWYLNSAPGRQYESFIAEELPSAMEALFPLTSDSRLRFIGGLSMGGYGAISIGLKYRSRYAGILGLSAVTDLWERMNHPEDPESREREASILLALGTTPKENSEIATDRYNLCSSLCKNRTVPVYLTIGEKDNLYSAHYETIKVQAKKQFHAPLITFREYRNCGHDFDCWTQAAKDGFIWMKDLVCKSNI